jgi:uncharacterized membrane protein
MTEARAKTSLFPGDRIRSLARATAQKTVLQWLFITVMALGLFFRIAHLDQKFYWVDEVATSMRLSGYTHHSIIQALVDGPIVTAQDLQRYQFPNPEIPLAQVLHNHALEDAHSPLFFLALRGWVQTFGHSLLALRSLSVIISILMLPAIYCLCRELSPNRLMPWMAVGLTAISPVQVIYAQEARHYGLWMLMILLSTTALLRAMRLRRTIRQRRYHWLIYAATVTCGYYAHVLFALIALSHGLYVWASDRWRITQQGLLFLLASSMGIFGFSPWLITLLNRPKDAEFVGFSALEDTLTLPSVLSRLVGVASRTFVDFGATPNRAMRVAGATQGSPDLTALNSGLTISVVLGVTGLATIAIAFLIYWSRRTHESNIWTLILSLIGVTPTAIIGGYLLLHVQLASTRYLLPVSLGLTLAMAYCLSHWLEAFPKQSWAKWAWQGAIAALATLGIISCVLRFNTPIWWNQIPKFTQDLPAIAQTLTQKSQEMGQPQMLIVDATDPDVNMLLTLGLSHQIPPETQIRLVKSLPIERLALPSDRTYVFLSAVASEEEKARVRKEKYGDRLVAVQSGLWKYQ